MTRGQVCRKKVCVRDMLGLGLSEVGSRKELFMDTIKCSPYSKALLMASCTDTHLASKLVVTEDDRGTCRAAGVFV